MSNNNKIAGGCLAICSCCCIILAIVLFAISGIIVPGANKAFIDGTTNLMVVDGFDDNLPENQFANSRKCAAYKATKDADYTTFKD